MDTALIFSACNFLIVQQLQSVLTGASALALDAWQAGTDGVDLDGKAWATDWVQQQRITAVKKNPIEKKAIEDFITFVFITLTIPYPLGLVKYAGQR